jgi:hypothetical protein
LARLVDIFEVIDLPYLLTGSLAASVHGMRRMTRDMDVLVFLDASHRKPFQKCLLEDFDVDPELVDAAADGLTQIPPLCTKTAMRGRFRRLLIVRTSFVLLLATLSAASGCTVLEEAATTPTPTPGPSQNLLLNPGFEDGDAPWFSLQQPEWSPFEISERFARGGDRSLLLPLRDDGSAANVRIAGAIQEVQPQQFPEFISGYYRVEGWEPDGVPFQYLQFVVVVHDADYQDEFDVHEIRFPLAGAATEPFQLQNSRWLFLGRDPPREGRWVYFGYPLRQSFADKWAAAPTAWTKIALYLEVRYDGRTAEHSGMSGDVYFDDMYLGPQGGNPNRPD